MTSSWSFQFSDFGQKHHVYTYNLIISHLILMRLHGIDNKLIEINPRHVYDVITAFLFYWFWTKTASLHLYNLITSHQILIRLNCMIMHWYRLTPDIMMTSSHYFRFADFGVEYNLYTYNLIFKQTEFRLQIKIHSRLLFKIYIDPI